MSALAKMWASKLAKAGIRTGETFRGIRVHGKQGIPIRPPVDDLEEAIANGKVHPDVVDELREMEKERLEEINRQKKRYPNDHLHPAMRRRLENGEYDEEYAQELREGDEEYWAKRFLGADMALGMFHQMIGENRDALVQYAVSKDFDWALRDYLGRRGLLDEDWLDRLERLESGE